MLAECGTVGATDEDGEGPMGGPVAGPRMLENDDDEEEEDEEDDEGEGREIRGAVPPDEDEDPGGGDRAPPSGVDGVPPDAMPETSGGGAPKWDPGVGTELRPSSSSSLLHAVKSMTTTRGFLFGRPCGSLDDDEGAELLEVDAIADELGLLMTWVSFFGTKGDQEPSSWNCTSVQSLGAFIEISMNNPSITNDEKVAGRSHTGHIHVGFFSFICK